MGVEIASLTFVKRFNPSAVVRAPPVAITYDVNNCLQNSGKIKKYQIRNVVEMSDGLEHLRGINRWWSRSIRVIDNGIECLIEPLPEYDGWRRFVKR